MKIFRSRPAIALAAAAVITMSASPAMARHRWHRNGVDGGDVLAGVLVVGGIAAIAAAVSNSNREKRDRDYRSPNGEYRDYRYPEGESRDDPRYSPSAGRYGDRPEGAPYTENWRGGASMDGAVDRCAGEIERGDRRIDTVESVNREGEGWRVDGRTSAGGDYSCTVGPDGRILRATIDGRAII